MREAIRFKLAPVGGLDAGITTDELDAVSEADLSVLLRFNLTR